MQFPEVKKQRHKSASDFLKEPYLNQVIIKVIPQKNTLWNDFLETFPECSLLIPNPEPQ